ncbi:MAG: FAD-dependent monooxygenase [Beijerinckiaceae bacterium]|nr:FAD-dependent monooxygenase [Beijerinckiaceae bacterium]
MAQVWDIAIAGGGATGLTLALLLRALSGGVLKVVLIDQSDPALRSGPRTSAIAEGPRRMFDRLGVWGKLFEKTQPILKMEISDANLADAVKTALLSFQSGGGSEPLAHMLFHRDLEPQLFEAATDQGVHIVVDALEDVTYSATSATLRTRAGMNIRTRLLVGADGLRSKARTAARIPVISWPYNRTALIFTIAHEDEHDGLAIQHFLEGGPFAVLPVTGRRSSIVWTEPSAKASELLRASPATLSAEIDARIGGRFGEIQIEEGPQSFPLVLQLARRFVGHRLALVGDAAHRVHPLAGQGLNIGLRDVATLAELVIERAKLGLDPGSEDLLHDYERRRRFDATASAAAFDFLHGAYSLSSQPARLAKRVGMGILDRTDGLKGALLGEASGTRGAIPDLFR